MDLLSTLSGNQHRLTECRQHSCYLTLALLALLLFHAACVTCKCAPTLKYGCDCSQQCALLQPRRLQYPGEPIEAHKLADTPCARYLYHRLLGHDVEQQIGASVSAASQHA